MAQHLTIINKMELKSIVKTVELSEIYEADEANVFNITYRFSLINDKLIDNRIEAFASVNGRQILNKTTSEGGKKTYGNTNEEVTDVTANLNDVINSGFLAIIAEPKLLIK